MDSIGNYSFNTKGLNKEIIRIRKEIMLTPLIHTAKLLQLLSEYKILKELLSDIHGSTTTRRRNNKLY